MTKKVTKKSNFSNNSFDFILFIIVLLLLALGLTMVLSASSPSSLAETGDDSYYYFRKQGIFAVMGFIAMMFISKVDYRFYKKFGKIAYWGSIILLLMVLVPGIGRSVNGAKRWITIGMQFQPSEVAKIGLIIFFATYFTENRKNLKGIWNGFFKPFCIVAVPVAVLLLVQDHLSASIVIIMVVAIMMIVAGCKLRYFLTAGAVGAAGGAGALFLLAKFTRKGWI